MWIELGINDKVTAEVTVLLQEFKRLDNSVADVVKSMHQMEAALGEDAMGLTRNSISQAKEYYNLVGKIAQAERDLNTVIGERKSRKMDTTQELRFWETLMRLREQLKNGVPLNDDDFTRSFKLSLENTIKEIKDQVSTAKEEMGKYDQAEKKKAETRRAITAETERLASAEEKLRRMRDDSYSKAIIADIKGQTVEYDAQMKKISELDALLKKVEKDRLAALRGSGLPHSTMTDSAITKEVDAIQRRYNEDVAKGNKLAQEAAEAKKQQEAAQNELNAKLRESERLEASVTKARQDAQSQSRIAGIQKRTADYNAAIIKARELFDLENKILADRTNIRMGGTATYTKERVTAELEAIQRRYNEALAAGREYERRDAEEKQRAAESSRRLAESNKMLMSSYDKVTQSGRQTMNTLSMLRQQAGYYFSLFGAQTLLRNVITIGGQFEFQHVALQNIIGDGEKANAVFSQLKDLAVESPKTFMELTASAKQLSAYQIPANELFDTTKRLSDLSVGLGVDINRLILAYGQVRSAAVLRGQELRQFTEAGIPMVQALAQKFTEMNGKLTTTADVFKLISQRAVSFEMVKEVLWDMTNQGGQFYNMQEEMADTLYGKWQKLQDIWQITLGDIADADSITGHLFRTALDGVIFLARNLQSLVPMLGVFGLFKGGKAMLSSNIFGMRAIDNNIAKAQQLTAIELRRKYINGEIDAKMYHQAMQLNAQKGSYYQVLALEGKISDKKIAQLAKEKEINRQFAYRYLLMKNYSKEQIRNAMANNGAGLAGMGTTIGQNALGFLGGWWGVASLALGGVLSVITAINAEAEELHEKGRAMAQSAQENSNTLLELFKNVEGSGDSTEKKIEAVEEALFNLGDAGMAIVERSREHMDDINERWRLLKQGAEDYQKTLDMMGSPEGQALYEKSIDESDIEDYIATYEKTAGAVAKQTANLNRFSATYKEMVASVAASNKVLAKQLEGKPLFEQLKIIPKKMAEAYLNAQRASLRGTAEYGNSRYGLALESLNAYYHLLGRVENTWGDITRESIPKMADELKAMAAHMNIDINDMSDRNKAALETLVRNYVNSFENASIETKNKLAETLASQVFHIKIQGDLSVDTSKLSSYANFIWEKFGGNGPTNGTVLIGNTPLSKQQVGNLFNTPESFEKALKGQYKDAKNNLQILKNTRGVSQSLLAEAEKEVNDKDAMWKAIRTDPIEDQKKGGGGRGGGGGGSKTDAFAKAMNERVSVLRDAYSEYKKWSALYGKERALAELKGSGLFDALFGDKDFLGLDDYKGELERLRGRLDAAKPEQRKVRETIDKILLGMKYDDAKEQVSKDIDLLQSAMNKIAKQWDTYKSLYEKTGDRTFAREAFGNSILWDGKSWAMARRLSDEVPGVIDYKMSEADAKKFFDYNTERGKKLYELWSQISTQIRDNYVTSLNEIADAQEKLATTAEKIATIDRKIADLREKGAPLNDPRILVLEKERGELSSQLFEESSDYLRFYSAVLSMTVDEAERIGTSIKNNLVDQFAKGNINADKFLKSMKNIDQQIEKSRSRLFGDGDLGTFLQGGQKGIVDKRYDEMANAAISVEEAQKRVLAARKKGDEQEILSSSIQLGEALQRLEVAKKALRVSQDTLKTMSTVAEISAIVMGTLEGMNKAAQALSDMFSATGHEDPANTWSDIADSISIISDTLKPVDGILQSLKSGNLSGAVSNAILAPVNLFTAPITGIAKLHDKKLDRAIERSQGKVKDLENEYKNLEALISSTLGGIYATGGYDKMFDNYKMQLAELEKQRDAEARKKDTDKEKMRDYDQQIKELNDDIADFAKDLAKSLYDIDIQSWAEQLTDAVVDAWAKGEDAVEAWHDKVVDLVGDVTKNIITKKIVETALEPVLDYVTKQMTAKSGKLDENDVIQMAKLLDAAGESSVNTIGNLLDALKRAGYDMSESSGGKSGGSSSSISSIREETADVIAGYINAIRADVSVNRQQLAQVLLLMQAIPSMNATAELQVRQLQMIADNTRRNADSAETIETFCNGLRDGIYSIKVK